MLQGNTTQGSTSQDNPGQSKASKEPRNGYRYRVLSYQRVSKEKETTGSHTFETQTLRIRQKLDETFGLDRYDLVEVSDDGLSGAYGFRPTGRMKKTRPSLQRIKAELLGGTFDAFVVYDLSRFCRSESVFYEMLDDVILPSGVLFLSATESFDFNSPSGRLVGGVMSSINAMFRDNVVKRNQDAAATRAEQGYFVGRPGYGWRWGEKAEETPHARRGLVPDGEKLEHVGRIVEQYLSGWSIIRITRELNGAGVPSPSGRSRWTNSVVFNVIDNPLHAGYIPWKGELIQGEHYAHRLYGEDRLAQIREARKRRSIMRTRTASVQVNLLLGFAVCARCGQRLYISGTQAKWCAYRCTNGLAQGQRTCPKVVAAADVVERAVLGAIQQIAERPDMQELLRAEASALVAQEDAGLRQERKGLKEQMIDQERQFERWALLSVQGNMTPEQFGGFNRKLQADQAATRARLAAVEAALASQTLRAETARKVQETLRDFGTVWHHLNLDERRQVLSLLVNELRIDREGTTIRVHLQTVLLPPQELCLAAPTSQGSRRKATGIAALTPRQLALLHHVNEGRSLKEASEKMGVSYSTVKSFSWQVQKELEIGNLVDAAALARPRINAVLGSLPLGPSADPRSEALRELRLSAKLMAVLPHLAKGATNAQIAAVTGLSFSTVGGRRKQIMSALGAASLYEAVQAAAAAGLL